MEPASLALILGASAASSAASVYNNRQNIRYAQEANDEAINLANTAHQREVRDLIAAGLNPILSASGSGAATPSLRVPNLESIDGGIANNATGLARAVSIQQGLENQALDIDNGLQAMELRKQNLLFDPAVQSAESQMHRDALMADFDWDVAYHRLNALYDYMYGRDGWKFERDKDGNPVRAVYSAVRPGFKKDLLDSVKADVKDSGTRYLQGWSNNIRGWADTAISGVNAAASLRRGNAMIRNADQKLLQDDFFRSREDVRRQERHDAWKFGGRRK